jgi:hypothetical protein
MRYSPPQLPRPIHPFSSTSFLSHPHLSLTMVLLVAPQTASKTAPSQSAGHAPLRLLLREAARAPVRSTRGAGASIRNRSPRPGARRRRELLLPVAKGTAREWELAGAVAPRGWVSSFAVRGPSWPPSSCTASASVPGRCKSLRTCCVCVLDMLQVFRANVSILGLNFLMLQIFNF